MLKLDLKHNVLRPFFLSVILLALVPLLAGTANLDQNSSAVPLEMFVALLGIVMLTPVFQPEQDRDISDLIFSKFMDPVRIWLARILCSLVILAVLISLFSGYMALRGCDITMRLVSGTLADAIFLGSLGMAASALCNNTVTGYMIPLVYYAVNYGAGNKLGNFYLFSMTAGSYSPKIWMLSAGLLSAAGALIIRRLRR